MRAMAFQITGVLISCSTAVFRAQIKENIKAPHHWRLWWESTVDQWGPLTKTSNARKYQFDDVIVYFDVFYVGPGRRSSDRLTHKQLKTHRCLLSTVATVAFLLQHQAISIHSANWICIVLDQFHTEIWKSLGKILVNKINFEKSYPVV